MLLRPYQEKIVAESAAYHRPLIVAPTGSGKTVIAAEVIRRAEHKHVLYLAHRRELIHQGQAKLRDFGVDSGLILAGAPTTKAKTRGVLGGIELVEPKEDRVRSPSSDQAELSDEQPHRGRRQG
jgi:DNA repair protein RadD